MEQPDIFSMTIGEIMQWMGENNAGHMCAQLDDKQGEPLGAFIFIKGRDETIEVMDAVNAITDQWNPDGVTLEVNPR